MKYLLKKYKIMERTEEGTWKTRQGERMEITFYSLLSFLVGIIIGTFIG